ncbi:protease complex subunit PrcB family protein [Flavobacterium fluviatile]|uniref:protease complex subunit PrcB family protein n=1 Tax=Flavobacterium fluviatile TaxID=1862387 RepID=UPI0013D73A18|nr:protease complex subunit PrcB family protein [Flavobacterium fluviatile]
MKQIITLFTILFLLTGCSNDNDNNDSGQSDVEFKVIAQGDPSPSQTENISKSNFVVKNTESWNAFLSKMSSYETSKFTETSIDFTKYQIIIVFDQVYGNGGHSIDITKITENNNSIFVHVEKLLKGNIATVVTQPYHIVKIAKSPKKVVFK